MTGTLPNGTPVQAIVVVPAENVLNRNQAWQDFERQWPAKYQIQTKRSHD